jgi:hypothetical protein
MDIDDVRVDTYADSRDALRPLFDRPLGGPATQSSRTVAEVGFAVRTDADRTPDAPSKPFVSSEDVASVLEPALNCTFRDGDFRRLPALVSEVLGVTVSLSAWRGIGGKTIFRLHGDVLEDRFDAAAEALEITRVDISQYVVDLLNTRTPFRWYVPSEADLAAENEHAKAIDRAYDR